MASTNINQYDQIIHDQNLLLEIGKHLENLSNYKDLTPLPRALIPEQHQIYGITFYKDGSIAAQSCVAYLLSMTKKTHISDYKCTVSPQKVANPDKWLQDQVVSNAQPLFPAETETFSAQSESYDHPYYHQFCSFKDQLKNQALIKILCNLKVSISTFL